MADLRSAGDPEGVDLTPTPRRGEEGRYTVDPSIESYLAKLVKIKHSKIKHCKSNIIKTKLAKLCHQMFLHGVSKSAKTKSVKSKSVKTKNVKSKNQNQKCKNKISQFVSLDVFYRMFLNLQRQARQCLPSLV